MMCAHALAGGTHTTLPPEPSTAQLVECVPISTSFHQRSNSGADSSYKPRAVPNPHSTPPPPTIRTIHGCPLLRHIRSSSSHCAPCSVTDNNSNCQHLWQSTTRNSRDRMGHTGTRNLQQQRQKCRRRPTRNLLPFPFLPIKTSCLSCSYPKDCTPEASVPAVLMCCDSSVPGINT